MNKRMLIAVGILVVLSAGAILLFGNGNGTDAGNGNGDGNAHPPVQTELIRVDSPRPNAIVLSPLTFSQPSTMTGILVFERSNPSGLPENDDEVRVPVRFSQSGSSAPGR